MKTMMLAGLLVASLVSGALARGEGGCIKKPGKPSGLLEAAR